MEQSLPPHMELVSALHSYENCQRMVDEPEVLKKIIPILVDRGYGKIALSLITSSSLKIGDMLKTMNYLNHQELLMCLKSKCPVIEKYMEKPRLTLSGLSNTCIVPHTDGKYILNVRIVNYMLDDKARFLLPKDQPYFDTNNLILEIGNDLKSVLNEKRFKQTWEQLDCKYRGIEDIRLLEHQKQLYYIGTICHESRLMMTFGRYDRDADHIPIRLIESPKYRQVEKNWCMFINQDDEICFVYQWFPLEIGKIEKDRLVITHQKDYGLWFMSRVKGSSCGVFDVETQLLWFLVHFHSDETPRQYYHMIVQMDPANYEIVRISAPFLFENAKVQFGMGLLVEKERLIITYTVFDRDARIASYDKQKLVKDILSDERAVFIRG